jgi:hypothetical protein
MKGRDDSARDAVARTRGVLVRLGLDAHPLKMCLDGGLENGQRAAVFVDGVCDVSKLQRYRCEMISRRYKSLNDSYSRKALHDVRLGICLE